MFSIDGDKITITKGDTGKFEISARLANGSSYVFGPSDLIEFKVKDSEYSETDSQDDYIIYKTGKSITIDPEDTINLKPKTYSYGVVVTLNSVNPPERYTIVGPADFKVIRGV